MPAIKTAFDAAFRDFQTADVPSSGAFEPIKGDIRNLGSVIETALTLRLLRFETIPLLRAEDAAAKYTTGEYAAVTGRAGPGDLRAFLVKWDATSTADHDGFNVFRPTVGAANSGPGRWLRVAANPSQTFATGVAIPSVANGQFFFAADTTITNFAGSHEGHTFTVARGATNVTIAHDPAKIDCGGADFKLTTSSPRAQFIQVGGVFLLLTPNPDAIIIPSEDAAFETVALATAATINAVTSQIVTLGHTAAGDGGQARWKRVGSAPSHGAKFTTNGGAVHWELDEETIDIRMVGARNDLAFNSAPAIQIAVDFAQTAGAEVKIPIGQFRIDATINVTKPIRIFGLGHGAGPGSMTNSNCSQITANFASGDMINVACLHGVTIELIQFNTNVGLRTGGAGVHIDGETISSVKYNNANSIIRRCAFNQMFIGVKHTDTSEGELSDSYFHAWSRSAFQNGSTGAEVGPGDITGNYFFGQTTSAATQEACLEFHSGYFRLQYNLILGAKLGVWVEIDQIASGNPSIKNNTIEEQAIGSVYVRNNSGAGVGVEKLAAMLQIVGNEFSNVTNTANFQAHITVVAGAASWITSIQIIGNVFKSTLLSGDYYIICNTGAGVQIVNNSVVADGAGTPIFVIVGAQATDVFIGHNSLTGTFSAKYSLTANCTLHDLQGIAFADLPSACANGSMVRVTNGTPGTSPLTGGGGGAVALRQASGWHAIAVGAVSGSYLPLTGGTLTDELQVTKNGATNYPLVRLSNTHGSAGAAITFEQGIGSEIWRLKSFYNVDHWEIGWAYGGATLPIFAATPDRAVAEKPIKRKSYTVATLPAGQTGDTAHCSNARVFNGAGTQEGSGSGTGGGVSYNGSAWKVEGTNVTAAA